MIFVTVGSQTPFDRLVRAVDSWCSSHHGLDVIAQIGQGDYVPKHMRWLRMCAPQEFRAHCQNATLIVAHAGMGSVLTALEVGRPMLLMPRQAALGETRNDHQQATARWLSSRDGIHIAEDVDQLLRALDQWVSGRESPLPRGVSAAAQPRLIAALRRFIERA